MMRGMGNMQGMLKQVKKMQKEMMAAQEALNQQTFIGVSTNDYVKANVTGEQQLKDLEINPAIIDDQDPEMLQDLVIMAVNDALQKAKKAQEDTLGKYTKGLPGF